MATFSDVGLALQIVQNVYGLCRDMADNAAGYKQQIGAGADPTKVAEIAKADAEQYRRRLKWIDDAIASDSGGVTESLKVFGIDLAELESLHATLDGAAAAVQTANPKDGKGVTDAADATLADVPAVKRLW